MDGIQIPREVAEAEGVPEDLDSSELGPYRFPNPMRRKNAAWIHLTGAALAGIGALSGLPRGLWVVAIMLGTIALLHYLAAWNLGIEQEEALAAAGGHVGFAVGHASAAVAFTGFRARPTWNVILYSAAEPPDQRALVRLDAVTGALVDEPYIEPLNT